MLSADRSIHDILFPKLHDQRLAMDNQFSGMSKEQFTYEDYEFINRKNIFSLALDPLVIDKDGYLSINENSFNPRSLFDLFYVHG